MYLKYCKRQTFKSKSHQSGAALIIALLIVFIVASLSVAISSDFLVMIRRVENQVHSNQAYAYLVGAEGLARYAILQDDNLASDHLGELFLSEQIVLPLTHADQIGQYSGSIEDLQGRLNINNLLSAAGSGTPYSVDQQRFIRLLQTLELEQPIDQPIAIEITHAVIDWLDPNSNERQPGGAEDLYYGDAIPAGKAANRGMVSITELRWVKGVTLELYEALKPHITVWGNGTVNINTATDNVLKSLNEDKVLTPLSDADFETLVAEIATAQD
ncbi:MAG: general secretion pathway protein K, partial [Pseudohongiellaceae bacterium]